MYTVNFEFRGYNLTASCDTPEALSLAVAELRNQFSRLPDAAPDRAPAQSSHSIAEDTKTPAFESEVIDVTEVSSEKMLKGKGMFFKLKGGRYDTYGVALYPDTVRWHDGLDKNNLQRRANEGLQMRVAKIDGKAKVISIRLKPKTAEN